MDVNQYPVFITCRDKVTHLIALISWLEKVGQTNIYLLDNDSSFPPLLNFYKETQYKVFYLNQNLGGRALWWSGLLDTLRIESRYIVSDPDVIPIEDCPNNAINVLDDVLNRFPDYKKVGFGLKTDDLPDYYKHKHDVIAWESRFYTKEIAPGLYDAAVDTTFALYQPGTEFGRVPSIRVEHPYLARHTPWYSDTNNPSDEDVFFAENLPSTHTTNWNQGELRDWLSKALGKTSKAEPAKPRPQSTTEAVSRTADYPQLTGLPWAQDLTRDAGRIESTQRFWKSVIEPVLEILKPKTIVEVGSYPGGNTRNILEFCQQNAARLHLADSAPGYDVSGWKEQYGDRLFVHEGFSLGAQLTGDEPEVVLINDSHNWHTVFGELELAEKKCEEKSRRFPLVMMHNIHWSHGSDKYRGSEEEDASPRSIWSFDKGGVKPRIHDSLCEHEAQNNLHTAIENFMNAAEQHFELLRLPGLHGLGILVPSELTERNADLARFLAIVDLPETIVQLVERTEEDRIDALAKLAEANRQLQESNKRIRQLNGERRRSQEANKKVVEANRKLRESNKKLRQLRGEKNQLQRANKQLQQSGIEMNDLRNSLILRIARKINTTTRKFRNILRRR